MERSVDTIEVLHIGKDFAAHSDGSTHHGVASERGKFGGGTAHCLESASKFVQLRQVHVMIVVVVIAVHVMEVVAHVLELVVGSILVEHNGAAMLSVGILASEVTMMEVVMREHSRVVLDGNHFIFYYV